MRLLNRTLTLIRRPSLTPFSHRSHHGSSILLLPCCPSFAYLRGCLRPPPATLNAASKHAYLPTSPSVHANASERKKEEAKGVEGDKLFLAPKDLPALPPPLPCSALLILNSHPLNPLFLRSSPLSLSSLHTFSHSPDPSLLSSSLLYPISYYSCSSCS